MADSVPPNPHSRARPILQGMEEEQAPALPRGGRSLWHDVVYGRQITGKPTGYARRVCGHRSMIGRLALDGKFMGHGGCVNTVAFSREGDLAVTGSDDTLLMVWDVATAQRKTLKLSGHSDNVFSARFLPFSDNSELVSVAADGEVRWHSLPLAERLGGADHNPRSSVGSRVLARHEGRAHRLCLLPGSAACFLSCGEDGVVYSFDMRSSRKTKLLRLTDADGDPTAIYALSVNPAQPYHFVVGGTAAAVSLFDARRLPAAQASSSSACRPAGIYAPRHMRRYGRGRGSDHITGVAYDWSGAEVLATYNDEHVYRFNIASDAVPDDCPSSSSSSSSSAATAAASESSQDQQSGGGTGAGRRRMAGQGGRRRRVRARCEGLEQGGEEDEEDEDEDEESDEEAEESEEEGDVGTRGYRTRYKGHRNDRTVKQVNFLGPRSEFVVSGSDDGHIFIWEKETGKLVQLLHGDRIGAVNCLEPHPNEPLLATSGLENDAKLWRPTARRAADPSCLQGRWGIPAQALMKKNEQQRKQAAGLSSITSYLMHLQQVMSMGMESSDESDEDEEEEEEDWVGRSSDSSSSSDPSSSSDSESEDEVVDEY